MTPYHKRFSAAGGIAAIALLLALIVLMGQQIPIHAEGVEPGTPTPPAPGTVRPLPVAPDQVISGVLPDLPPGYMIVEGDIQVPIAEFQRRYRQSQGDATTQLPEGTYETNLWPNGVVPYEFDANVTAANRTAMGQAMQQWQNVANVQFTLCINCLFSLNYIHIQNSLTSNNSAVGRQGGKQIINIVSWGNTFIMAHELGHALGLEHEQSRTDRDSFITVNLANVCKAVDANCNGGFCFDNANNRIDCDFNFNVISSSLTYGAYDFGSIMLYGRNAFSRNGSDTITVLPPNDTQWQNLIGQRARLSVRDQNVMGCLYPRAEWRWVATTGVYRAPGTCTSPYWTIHEGMGWLPSGGTLWIEPGYYAEAVRYNTIFNRAMTLIAPNGIVTIGP